MCRTIYLMGFEKLNKRESEWSTNLISLGSGSHAMPPATCVPIAMSYLLWPCNPPEEVLPWVAFVRIFSKTAKKVMDIRRKERRWRKENSGKSFALLYTDLQIKKTGASTLQSEVCDWRRALGNSLGCSQWDNRCAECKKTTLPPSRVFPRHLESTAAHGLWTMSTMSGNM